MHVAGADDRFDRRWSRKMRDEAALEAWTESVGGAGGLRALDHADLHAAFRRALQLDVVHEVADEEDAAAARLQQVFGRQRIGHLFGIEAFALIADADCQLRHARRRSRLELDEHALARRRCGCRA